MPSALGGCEFLISLQPQTLSLLSDAEFVDLDQSSAPFG